MSQVYDLVSRMKQVRKVKRKGFHLKNEGFSCTFGRLFAVYHRLQTAGCGDAFLRSDIRGNLRVDQESVSC